MALHEQHMSAIRGDHIKFPVRKVDSTHSLGFLYCTLYITGKSILHRLQCLIRFFIVQRFIIFEEHYTFQLYLLLENSKMRSSWLKYK
jgi:hypothetical protein